MIFLILIVIIYFRFHSFNLESFTGDAAAERFTGDAETESLTGDAKSARFTKSFIRDAAAERFTGDAAKVARLRFQYTTRA
ncbi:unnamed protein product [Brassica oleracea]|uniref:(rape) hypothetical protein n=1 Tax=Brassica napus TaxID=3708 RepID=A0A816QZV7_BRANA|nr:unnamed protein product [Brassica napus]